MTSTGPSENTKIIQGLELPPFRNFQEFLLETDRYERPPMNDFKKWNNRIISNLLYFQTNYFVTIISLFLIYTCFSSQDIFIGLIAIVSVAATLIFAVSTDANIKRLRTDHPLVTLGGIILVAYFFISVFQSVLVVVFALLFPVFLVLAHASFRLRGLANRAANVKEQLGIRTTVMGQILDRTGLNVRM
uniref:PRA1 family protein n=1 Tax=Caenorhabditis japonica TaxID=281687 RepID=A0A8R1I372_CAEJA